MTSRKPFIRTAAFFCIAILAALALSPSLDARRTRTTRPKLRAAQTDSLESRHTFSADSARGIMRISGYEKTLRSRTESFYVENLDTLDTLTRITASIDYLDMKQRQLHRRTVSVECNIPPGQRRLLTFPTWDRQFVMYYHLSAPARSSAQATAYDVKISPLAAEVSPAYSTSPNR